MTLDAAAHVSAGGAVGCAAAASEPATSQRDRFRGAAALPSAMVVYFIAVDWAPKHCWLRACRWKYEVERNDRKRRAIVGRRRPGFPSTAERSPPAGRLCRALCWRSASGRVVRVQVPGTVQYRVRRKPRLARSSSTFLSATHGLDNSLLFMQYGLARPIHPTTNLTRKS